MGKLTPNLSTLPPRQRQIWTRLATTPKDFVLYGGTALALRLGHRESVDFDFFSSRLFQPIELIRSIPYLAGAEITQEEANTLSCAVPADDGVVSVSFFAVSLNQVETPDVAEGNGIAAAAAIYGRQYNPVLTLQALAYFDDLPEPFPAAMKADLLAAVKSVSLQNLPTVIAAQRIGAGIAGMK